MVKFAKQLEVQAVPEWGVAYCSYKQLKKSLKHIKEQLLLQRSKSGREGSGRGRRLSFDTPKLAFSVTRRRSYQLQHAEFIRVHLRELPDGGEVFETELQDTGMPSEHEKNFFTKLDEQLNKVNDFYRSKEAEYIFRAEMLDKQMEALLEMRKVLEQSKSRESTGSTRKESDSEFQHEDRSAGRLGVLEEGEPAFIPPIVPSGELIKPCSNTSQPGVLEEAGGQHGKNGQSVVGGGTEDVAASDKSKKRSAGPLGNGGCVSRTPPCSPPPMKMSIPRTTPRATISALTQVFWDDLRQQLKGTGSDSKVKDDLTVSRKKVQYAAKMLRTAFIEFYRGLTLLKSFSSLNVVAFGKILKKYDKITGRRASENFLKAVEGSYFHSSDKVAKLLEKVEIIFTAHFTNDDRQQAMKSLRPLPQKSSHTVSFFLGLFSGCSLSLFAAFGIVVHIGGNYVDASKTPNRPTYMESIFPVFSMLALIVLHLYMYGWNVYMWRRARINYAFIFEFAPGAELRYREVLLVASGLTSLVVGGMLAHLVTHFAVKSETYRAAGYVDIIPLGVVTVFVLLLFLPLNTCYYSSRKFFLRCMTHIIMSPLYKVVLADFFLADQLTSQVQMLRNLEFFTCYYLGGFFTKGDTNTCLTNKHYKDLAYVISLLPYFCRLMQCLRRWIDEGDRAHIANGGKYLSAMFAVSMKLTYTKNNGRGWLAMFIVTSTIATMYQLYWDLVVDWGLLQPKSKNPWLRDQLLLRNKSIYLASMVANAILRLPWLLSVTHLQLGNMDPRLQDLLVAGLEVVRRGQWNFFRLENEHLNNVGKYRAVKTVPLPFREVDSNDADV